VAANKKQAMAVAAVSAAALVFGSHIRRLLEAVSEPSRGKLPVRPRFLLVFESTSNRASKSILT
jgi:hypothetical protein